MAANLTDDELRSRLSSILGSSKNIPPIVDATRPLLMEKLSRLQCHGELETISDDAKCLSVPKAVCLLFIPLKLHKLCVHTYTHDFIRNSTTCVCSSRFEKRNIIFADYL